MKQKRKNRPFTLFEIVLCIALLSLLSVGLALPFKDFLSKHKFNKTIDDFLLSLRQAQFFALADRIDYKIAISTTKDGYEYIITTDEPNAPLKSKKANLEGVKTISINQKPITTLTLTVFSSGRIEPLQKIEFSKSENEHLFIDLTTPLCIELAPS